MKERYRKERMKLQFMWRRRKERKDEKEMRDERKKARDEHEGKEDIFQSLFSEGQGRDQRRRRYMHTSTSSFLPYSLTHLLTH